jgi:hypothetical protein
MEQIGAGVVMDNIDRALTRAELGNAGPSDKRPG